jgi:hypothetical protein
MGGVRGLIDFFSIGIATFILLAIIVKKGED